MVSIPQLYFWIPTLDHHIYYDLYFHNKYNKAYNVTVQIFITYYDIGFTIISYDSYYELTTVIINIFNFTIYLLPL